MRPAQYLTVVLVAAVACRPASEDMARQDRFEGYEESSFFDDGSSARHLPRGVVARVPLHDAHTPRLDDPIAPIDVARLLVAVDRAMLARGRERFGIWCTPCHGYTGLGNGAVVQRGYPEPPSFVEPRLREASDSHLYRVITEGLGKMPPYGPHVPPADRVAIIAWIRVLQRSQHAKLDAAPPVVRARLTSERGERPR